MLKKKRKQRRKPDLENPYGKTWKNKAIVLWGRLVRAVKECAVCKRDGDYYKMESHHLLTRGAYPKYQFDLYNGICLCVLCHKFDDKLSAHRTPEAFDRWLEKNKPEHYKWKMQAGANKKVGGKTNYQEVYEQLLQAATPEW